MDDIVLDVSIIGSGVIGICTSWRLFDEDAGGSEVLRALMRARGSACEALSSLDQEG